MKMKTLKNLLIIFLIFLIPFGFFYLAISFVSLDLNVANWGAHTRFIAILVPSMVSFFGLYCFFAD